MRNFVKALFITALFAVIAFGQMGFTHVGQNSFYDGADTNAVWYGSYDSRGLCAGSDLDGDGKQEVFIANYGCGGTVIGFEAVDSAVLEMIWTGDTSVTTYRTGTRAVQTGDLDGDDLGEVIFFRGIYESDPNAGLYVYEADGTDNGFKAKKFWSINDLGAIFNFNGKGKLARVKVESFVVDDVDNDGVDEIIFASNGSSYLTDYIDTVIVGTDTTYDTYGHSEDFFAVLSATGDLQAVMGGGDLICEFVTSARDIDMGTADTSSALFGRENKLGGGSAVTVAVSDIDGDGHKEIFCNSWNKFNSFFVEAIAPNTYSFGDTTNVVFGAASDGVALMQAAAADLDGNGKDELYASDCYSGYVYAITDNDGEATNLDSSEFTIIDSASVVGGAWISYGVVTYDFDGDGTPEAYLGGSGNDDILKWDGSAWTTWTTDTTAGGFVSKMDVGDLDGDGNYELITAHQSVLDSLEQVTGDSTSGFDTTIVVNPHIWFVRVSEFGDDELGVTNYRIVTPMDYKLENAYPNPFNPTTTIKYSLPINKQISLIVYNQLGQKVVTLIDNKKQNSGTYEVVWNGTNSNGKQVASGVYFYMLKYGNYSQTKKVTFLK